MSATTWTDWSCTVRVVTTGRDVVAARGQVRAVMALVARAADRFDPTSDVSRVSAVAGEPVRVDDLTLDLVAAALAAAELTDGLHDPTVGHLLDAWGYDRTIEAVRRDGTRRVPDLDALARADWRGVRLDRAAGTVSIPAGTGLDLGGPAKAWAAQEGARRAHALTGAPTLVEIGGDVAVAGEHPWTVRVAEREGEAGELVTLHAGALTTSSTTARRWQAPEGARHHLLDPRTSRPALGPWRTVSCWHDDAVVADAWSAAAIVAGEGADVLLRTHGVPARLVHRDGFVVTTPGWPARSWAVAA